MHELVIEQLDLCCFSVVKENVCKIFCIRYTLVIILRWLDTVFKNSGV
jgi:hypothetical protein